MKLNDFRLPHRYYHFSPLQTDRQILNVRLHLSCIRVNVRVFWTTDEIAVLCVCVCLCEREERTGEGENNKNSHSAVLYLVSAWLKSFPVAPWTLGGFRGLLLWGSFIRFNSYHSFNQQMVWQIKDAEAQRKDKKLNSLFFNLFFTKRRREVQIHKNYKFLCSKVDKDRSYHDVPATVMSPEAYYKPFSGATHTMQHVSMKDTYDCQSLMRAALGKCQSVITWRRENKWRRSKVPQTTWRLPQMIQPGESGWCLTLFAPPTHSVWPFRLL